MTRDITALQVGELRLDLVRYEIRRAGKPVHLTPKAMELLILVASNRPRMMTKAELIDQLWPDVVVVPANLRNLVAEIRKALDDADGRIIRTIHGRGYSFTEDATELHDSPITTGAPLVTLRQGRRRFVLWPGENRVGRDQECEIFIPDSRISRRHARIIVDADATSVEDMGSRNGTFVCGKRVEGVSRLLDGDEISFGPLRFTISIADPREPTETATR